MDSFGRDETCGMKMDEGQQLDISYDSGFGKLVKDRWICMRACVHACAKQLSTIQVFWQLEGNLCAMVTDFPQDCGPLC